MPSLLEKFTSQGNGAGGAPLLARAWSHTRSVLQHDTERLAEPLPPRLRNRQGARIPLLRHPAQFEAAGCQRCTQATSQVRPPLAPVQARSAEHAPPRRRRGTEGIEEPLSNVGDLAAVRTK